MKDIARLSFKGGGMILPVQTSYERELLIEHLEASAKRHGHVLLDVDGSRWSIRASAGLRAVCHSCSRWPAAYAYPGGSSRGLSVISSGAALCTDVACELSPVAARA